MSHPRSENGKREREKVMRDGKVRRRKVGVILWKKTLGD